MPTSPSFLRVTLQRAQFLRLERPAGVCLRVARGTLWVTIDGQAVDLELDAGQRHCFDGPAPVLIGTLGGEAAFCAERPTPRGTVQLAWT